MWIITMADRSATPLHSPSEYGDSGLMDKKGQGVGRPAMLQQCCGVDQRHVSERLRQPALRPLAHLFGVSHMGTITYSAVALSTRTTCQPAIAVVHVIRAIGYVNESA